jgi:hypothetical protein
LTLKSSQNNHTIESIPDPTKDILSVTSTSEPIELRSSVDNYSKIERNITARSKRRTEIVKDLIDKDLHDLQDDTAQVLYALEEPQRQIKDDSEEIIVPKNDQRQITSFKSLVANAAKPLFV